jgi:hypothetical protein
MDIVNFDALKAQDRIIDPSQVDPEEDYFIIGKYTNHYTTNSMKYTKYPVFAIKAGDVMGTLPAYKVCSAILSQSGTNPPVATILENTLGVTPTWYYDSQGNYRAEALGVFTLGKTVIVPGVINFTALNNNTPATVDEVFIETIDSMIGPNDGLLNNTFIEIRVYN